SGITDYRAFALDILSTIRDRPISFEVFSDDFEEMERQALEISEWGENVFVKIPVMNTKREPANELISRLSRRGVKLNVTAVFTLRQVQDLIPCLTAGPQSYISIFAGRIADTGLDPIPIMFRAVQLLLPHSHLELIWASPRELLNIF